MRDFSRQALCEGQVRWQPYPNLWRNQPTEEPDQQIDPGSGEYRSSKSKPCRCHPVTAPTAFLLA
jgi:hypothetical protein